jgi:hypothetical protein
MMTFIRTPYEKAMVHGSKLKGCELFGWNLIFSKGAWIFLCLVVLEHVQQLIHWVHEASASCVKEAGQ